MKYEKSLAAKHPELAAEWHPTKNGDLTPQSVATGSHKKVWWLGKCGHEWQAVIQSRSNGCSCPFCSGRFAIPGETDLATTHPELAAQWHPIKNGELTPQMVMPGSGEKAWWICSKGHEWQATVANRTKGIGCPICSGKRVLAGYNDLATTHPEKAAQWHPALNGELTPQDVTFGQNKKVWWLGRCGHEWQATINNSSRAMGCPVCNGKKTLLGFNDLATVNPELAAQWHPIKNGELTPEMVVAGSNKKVWWQCSKGHEWQSMIESRAIDGHGCPICANQIILPGYNDLATTHSELAAQWHPTKNGKLTPQMVPAGRNKGKIWWICEKGHEWQAVVASRSAGVGCPICAGRMILPGFNDLATVNPELAAEWHPTKNGDLTPDKVTAGNHKKVWWICDKCGHEWQATVANRSNGTGCPECTREQKTSFPEKVVLYYIQKTFSEAIANVKKDVFPWLGGMELDIYVPSLQLAVEYDGPLHNQERDQRKNYLCAQNGITIVRIRSHKLQYSLSGSVNFHLSDESIESLTAALMEVYQFISVRCGKLTVDIDIDIDRDRIEIMELLNLHEKENSLATQFPELAAQWHPTKNGDLTPQMVTSCSGKKVWWICRECGHEWEAIIGSRFRGNGCPVCGYKKRGKSHAATSVCSAGSLAHNNPKLAAQWHPTRNGELTPDKVTAGNHKKVWWICEKGHEWQAAINNRHRLGRGCPACYNARRGKNRKNKESEKEQE